MVETARTSHKKQRDGTAQMDLAASHFSASSLSASAIPGYGICARSLCARVIFVAPIATQDCNGPRSMTPATGTKDAMICTICNSRSNAVHDKCVASASHALCIDRSWTMQDRSFAINNHGSWLSRSLPCRTILRGYSCAAETRDCDSATVCL